LVLITRLDKVFAIASTHQATSAKRLAAVSLHVASAVVYTRVCYMSVMFGALAPFLSSWRQDCSLTSAAFC
jgi:hypothetical protein